MKIGLGGQVPERCAASKVAQIGWHRGQTRPFLGAGFLFQEDKEGTEVKRFVAVVLCFMCLAVTLSACATRREDGPIFIGAAGPFTGELSKIGLDSLNAIEMAVKEFNDAGGIDGRLVEVLEGDDAGDPATGNVVADKFGGDPRVLGVMAP